MIQFACDKCGKKFQLKPEFAGRKTTCSGCKAPLLVPTPIPTTIKASADPALPKIAFACDKCGTKFSVPGECAGRSTSCPTCKSALTVPASNATLAYVPPAGKIAGTKSSVSEAGIDGGVTLAGDFATAEALSMHNLIDGKGNDGARYVVENELARGGMGAVMRAVDCDIRREVAVKYLLDQADRGKKQRFVEEAQITGQLEHPNIVPIHELGIDADKRIFFAMKMVRGRSLADILKELEKTESSGARRRSAAAPEFSQSRLLNIFISICNALAYAHSRGVVHRDLKPANIMVGDFGEVYVMDWGLAKVLKRGVVATTAAGPALAIPVAKMAEPFDFAAPPMATPVGATSHASGTKVVTSRDADADLTQDGAILGTPVYMPPEQAAGKIDDIDERSDIYSMGAILYEMLALEPPIDRQGGYWPILMRVTQGNIVPPQAKNPQRAGRISPELSAIAMKALSKDKADRYATVEALRRDVELFMEGRSVSAKEDTRTELLIKFVKRNKAFSAATAAAAVLLFIVVSWAMIANYRERRETQRAYDAYAIEQKEKEERTRRAVPALVEIARRDAELRHFKKALEQVQLALEYDPNHVQGRLLHAQLLMVNQDFKKAVEELETYLAKNPKDGHARELKKLCAKADPAAQDKGPMVQIAQVLTAQNQPGMAEGFLRHYGKDGNEVRAELLSLYRKRIAAHWPSLGDLLTMDAKTGDLSMNVEGDQVTNLAPLKDIPLRTLNISGRNIEDLSAVRGMPLVSIRLFWCERIKHLNDLKGIPLTSIYLQRCFALTDISGLAGAPLTSIDISECNSLSDFAPLRGAPLERVEVNGSSVSNLDALNGPALEFLKLSSCPNVRDISPLQGAKIRTLVLSGLSVADLGPLKGMPIQQLDLTNCTLLKNLTPLEGLPLKQLSIGGCLDITDLSPLRSLPLQSLDVRSTRLTDLNAIRGLKLKDIYLGNCDRLEDISALEGMPLESIFLTGCKRLQDLSPLKGMPFNRLEIQGCEKIKSLAALKGMPLGLLLMNNCSSIADLEPLRGGRLNHLEMANCPLIADLSPLKDMQLARLEFSGCTGLKSLNGLQGQPLGKMNLVGLANLENIDALKGMPLGEFQVDDCPKLQNLDALQSMQLYRCEIRNCPNLSDIRGLGGKRNYHILNIANCPKIEDLSPLAGIPMQELTLHGLQKLTSLSFLDGSSLQSLNLDGCGKLTDLTMATKANGLKAVIVARCPAFTDLTPLSGLKLASLNIDSTAVKNLAPLRGIPLQQLGMRGCADLHDLSPLAGMSLVEVTLPPEVTKGMEGMRAMKTLQRIDTRPADQFWQEWDRMQVKSK
ncbi:MAG TPA: protein kinase [Gemmataceae bacterium]|nr:protein kinase [Gemmataceae bacterium]